MILQVWNTISPKTNNARRAFMSELSAWGFDGGGQLTLMWSGGVVTKSSD